MVHPLKDILTNSCTLFTQTHAPYLLITDTSPCNLIASMSVSTLA